MNKQLAFIFPGQGSQRVGMCRELIEAHPIVGDLFAIATKTLNYDLLDIVLNGPAESLNQTIFTQPAMLVADIAYWYVWQKTVKVMPTMMAGHSLGEFAALVVADALEFTDAVQLVAKRGDLMQAAIPQDQGGMAVILGLTDSQVIGLCQAATQGEDVVEAVNFNSPGQVVIAGTNIAIARATELAITMQARLIKKLPVSVPSHSCLMRVAAKDFSDFLNQVPIKTPKIPVIHNVDVTVAEHPDDIRAALAKQMHSPVRWVETILRMSEDNIKVMVECGPGKVLTGLNKRIDPELKTYALSDTDNWAVISE